MEDAWRGCGGAPMWVVQLSGIVELTKAIQHRLFQGAAGANHIHDAARFHC